MLYSYQVLLVVYLPESPSLYILSTEPHMRTLHQKRAKCQGFTHCPVHITLFQQITASFKDAAQS